MAKVLYIKANPKKEEDSISLSIGRQFINSYKEKNQTDEIIEVDVYKDLITFIDDDVLNSWQKLRNNVGFHDLTESEQQKIHLMNGLVDEFISADKYIIASPMWNFSVPPLLKAYIDNILIAGKTFKYTETGPVGLLQNKKMLHIQASGGVYENSTMDFSAKYISAVFKFIGVEDIRSILIQGVNLYPDKLVTLTQEAAEKAKLEALSF